MLGKTPADHSLLGSPQLQLVPQSTATSRTWRLAVTEDAGLPTTRFHCGTQHGLTGTPDGRAASFTSAYMQLTRSTFPIFINTRTYPPGGLTTLVLPLSSGKYIGSPDSLRVLSSVLIIIYIPVKA